MRKEIKEKKKKLSKPYDDYLFEVLQYLRKLNLSKYSYLKMRDEAIEQIYNAEHVDEVGAKESFKRGHEAYFDKKTRNLPKKSVLEQVCSFFFAFFLLFFVLMLFVYIYRFASPVPGTFYSEGIYLNVGASNIAIMSIYGFLGALLSIIIQRNDKRTKYILLASTAGLGLAIVLTFFAISNAYTGLLKINVILFFVVCALLSAGGFLLESYISKKRLMEKEKNSSGN